jgi:hypothetical protein
MKWQHKGDSTDVKDVGLHQRETEKSWFVRTCVCVLSAMFSNFSVGCKRFLRLHRALNRFIPRPITRQLAEACYFANNIAVSRDAEFSAEFT